MSTFLRRRIFIRRLAAYVPAFRSIGWAVWLVAFAAGSVCAQSWSRQRDPALFYLTGGDRALASFAAHHDQISTLAPQAFALTSWGALRGGIAPRWLDLAHANHVRLMPLVINDNFSSWVATRMLRSPAACDRAIGALLATARRDGLAGWQLDFEGLPDWDRARLTHFVREAARALHHRGLALSVAVAARTDNLHTDSYIHFTGVYDYHALARYADFLTVMAYPESGRHHPGPLASYPWVAQVLSFILQSVPPNKISLGIPDYQSDWGYHRVRIHFWRRVGHRLRRFWRWAWRLIGFSGRVRTQPGDLHWDPKLRSAYRVYGHGLHRHVVWVEDRRSLEAKLDLVSIYHLRGYSIWRLGLEDASIWTILPRFKPVPAVVEDVDSSASAAPLLPRLRHQTAH